MRKETKIGRTTYIVGGNFRADGKGIDLSSVLLRLMEKDLQAHESVKFQNGAAFSPTMCYNGVKSQNSLGCGLQAKEGVLV